MLRTGRNGAAVVTCQRCGREHDGSGGKLCGRCRDYIRDWQNDRYERGLCRDCSQRRVAGRYRCEEHLKEQREKQAERRSARRSAA